jgi:hypothetical protein
MLEARLADSPVAALIVDLDAPDTALALLRRVRPADPSAPEHHIRTLAFGPHVDTASLEAARQAGADTVTVRGALHARLPEVLRELTVPLP